ncbi:hypothetical protein J2Y45_004222 [Dyadobacter sp. BE34]|uniref:DUF4369 domain-containing protein n=1 Tax=Dyadobacter fermentans TaxID=94254 RepID=A0ABU1R270_9BACT|nr:MULTISPECIES: hypothetical protein [Dyadobacter]MDR6807443.1 hypothetical protein [Dyadobacter fermentans]MDR7045184.1 hypothetical protein [Dyadobacter sp. BE242]MDR7199079.1 hypothetical protein [Dyadobacter sp. BE34]MDR7217039.1 hypothetical protein [Dyadobacter sp. BE31]MDR7264972.1 hypothetical protein [Dyadobacter sp. BE32]
MISRTNLLIICVLACLALTSTQRVKIKIIAPKAWNDRKALLLTREKGFAAVVHSIKLGFDTTHLMMDADLLPDLYQFQVSQKKGALTFFFDPGTEIRLDTSNLSKSAVTHSKSNEEWQEYQSLVQATEREKLWDTTADFITNHPKSYVSLYLLKVNWFALKNRNLFEKLDRSLAHHRNYRFLKERNIGIVKSAPSVQRK